MLLLTNIALRSRVELGFSINVSARNVFRYLCSIFMLAAFLVIFVFAPLVLFFGSLVFHCLRSFVLRVRVFLHIVYLSLILTFRVSSSLVGLGPTSAPDVFSSCTFSLTRTLRQVP